MACWRNLADPGELGWWATRYLLLLAPGHCITTHATKPMSVHINQACRRSLPDRPSLQVMLSGFKPATAAAAPYLPTRRKTRRKEAAAAGVGGDEETEGRKGKRGKLLGGCCDDTGMALPREMGRMDRSAHQHSSGVESCQKYTRFAPSMGGGGWGTNGERGWRRELSGLTTVVTPVEIQNGRGGTGRGGRERWLLIMTRGAACLYQSWPRRYIPILTMVNLSIGLRRANYGVYSMCTKRERGPS